MDLLGRAPPLPPNPTLPPHGAENGYFHPERPQQQQHKRKKRGRRGSGLGPNSRAFKPQHRGPQQLGFFGNVPDLQDMRQENWRRTQQHFGQPPRGAFQQQPQGSGPHHQQPGSGRNRRSRAKGFKPLKHTKVTPRPMPLTPAGNPLDTPANVGKAADTAAAPGVDKLEAEGLQAGLDWYATNENSASLFITGQQLTTSDSEEDLMMGGEEEEEGSEGEAHSGGGGGGDAALPGHVRARLVEQEAYIAELEDQNLRLREQLEMLQQEMEELRGQGGRPLADSEGFAEHSEGSLPADLSVMQSQHHP